MDQSEEFPFKCFFMIDEESNGSVRGIGIGKTAGFFGELCHNDSYAVGFQKMKPVIYHGIPYSQNFTCKGGNFLDVFL